MFKMGEKRGNRVIERAIWGKREERGRMKALVCLKMEKPWRSHEAGPYCDSIIGHYSMSTACRYNKCIELNRFV